MKETIGTLVGLCMHACMHSFTFKVVLYDGGGVVVLQRSGYEHIVSMNRAVEDLKWS